MDLIKTSKQTRIKAEKILTRTNLVGLLSKYGDVRIGGSYFTDLMYGPDIDITVVTKTPRESALNFLREVMKRKYFQKYQYGDFETFPREHRPKDHIVVLILPLKNVKWEIEVWFSKKHYQNQIKLEEKLKNLPLKTKLKIIKLKAQRDKSGKDKYVLPSFQIYKNFV